MLKRGLLLLFLVAVAGGGLALAASGREPAAKPAVAAEKKSKTAELPPLPEMRPKVVEPVAGNGGDAAAPETDPGLTEVGPKPKGPATSGGTRRGSAFVADPNKARALGNGVAVPPLNAPEEVRQIIEAGNIIARTPYIWGGGHGKWLDKGYDCSGSVSFALAAAGLLNGPMASGPLMSWGEPGPGKWVTIEASDGHVYMYVAGVRFDTSNSRVTGSRWSNTVRSNAGFVARHPAGL